MHYKHLVQRYQGSPPISNLRPGWRVGGASLKSHYKPIFHIPSSSMFQGVKSSMYIPTIFKQQDSRAAQTPRWQPLTLAYSAFISFQTLITHNWFCPLHHAASFTSLRLANNGRNPFICHFQQVRDINELSAFL